MVFLVFEPLESRRDRRRGYDLVSSLNTYYVIAPTLNLTLYFILQLYLKCPFVGSVVSETVGLTSS